MSSTTKRLVGERAGATMKKAQSEPSVPTYSPTPKRSKAAKPSTEHPDRKLMGLIRSLGGKEDHKGEKGKNYVFKVKLQHAPDLDIIKVGFTKRDVSRRQSNIKSRCNIETTCEMISTERHIQHYKKAESLIKADLRNWLHEFECECGQSHTEYFAITVDMAWEITSRWKDFCEADPWTDKGNLHPFWDDRLNNVYGAGEDDKNNDWKSRSCATQISRKEGARVEDIRNSATA
ncbi:hypothetical protein ACO1O0_005889 [Amphichorda felina]